jgi:hypothetical protein
MLLVALLFFYNAGPVTRDREDPGSIRTPFIFPSLLGLATAPPHSECHVHNFVNYFSHFHKNLYNYVPNCRRAQYKRGDRRGSAEK